MGLHYVAKASDLEYYCTARINSTALTYSKLFLFLLYSKKLKVNYRKFYKEDM